MQKLLILLVLLSVLTGCANAKAQDPAEIAEPIKASVNYGVSDIYLDRYFIAANEELYLKYRQDFADARSTVEYVNTMAYLTPNEDYVNSDLTVGTMIMANKYHYLGEYVPKDLVQTDALYGQDGRTALLNAEAYEAYKKMYTAAATDGMKLVINSFYRSYALQVATYNNFLTFDPQEKVDTYSSRPGFSDHQTGLVVDILTPGHSFDTFEDTPEAAWLAENAHNYGFILRYPKGKENITKYKYEAWHYRYVGEEAQAIFASGLTFDEYYAYYYENK